jgi:hypothetical protein
MRPAALAPADGPVLAVQHERKFFSTCERPKRDGSQRILQAGPKITVHQMLDRVSRIL